MKFSSKFHEHQKLCQYNGHISEICHSESSRSPPGVDILISKTFCSKFVPQFAKWYQRKKSCVQFAFFGFCDQLANLLMQFAIFYFCILHFAFFCKSTRRLFAIFSSGNTKMVIYFNSFFRSFFEKFARILRIFSQFCEFGRPKSEAKRKRTLLDFLLIALLTNNYRPYMH